MKAIVCVDLNWGIGKKNDLLFSLKKDMAFFREKTMDKIVVMGGNTLLSFPGSKPLKNRTNIVISDVFTRDDCICVETLEELKAELKKYNSDDTYVIGGAMMYKTMLPYCDTVYVTKVNADGGAEVFYPNLDQLDNWQIESETVPEEDNGYQISFVTYRNSEVQPL